MNIEVNNALYKEIKEYCDTNSLDIDEFLDNIIKSGFACEKYGLVSNIRQVKEEKIDNTENNSNNRNNLYNE